MTAEILMEQAESLEDEANLERRKAEIFSQYREDSRISALADESVEIAEDLESEVSRLYEWAWEQKRTAERWEYEAEELSETDDILSGWYAIFEK